MADSALWVYAAETRDGRGHVTGRFEVESDTQRHALDVARARHPEASTVIVDPAGRRAGRRADCVEQFRA